MADEGESLESWLNKATNPSNRQEDWEYIIGFCDQINKELEGPQISVRLLAHKIQSPQEWEAVQALVVLEACMKNCGRRFHTEVGKFRFLNELIKVVSPKYLGDRVSDRVKTKVIEMLFGWTVSLPEEAKIAEAYQMLKRQGIVSVDPEMPLDNTLIPSTPPRPTNPVFENEEKSKRLAELLKSKKPEDLQEANRLIKNMVKEDEVRMQKATKRNGTLEEVGNSVKLLNEMLTHFSAEDSTEGDKELIRELYGDCDKLRRSVFQLATETEDNDSNLGAILQASDDLSRVINSYKKVVEAGQAINGEREEALTSSSTTLVARAPDSSGKQSEILIDLVGLDLQSPSPPPAPWSLPADLLLGSTSITSPGASSSSTPSTALSLLDGELFYLGLNDPAPAFSKSDMPKDENLNHQLTSLQASNQDFDIFSCASLPAPVFSTSSLFTDSLALTVAPVSRPQCSITASSMASPAPVFSTSSLFTDSLALTVAPVSTTASSMVSPAPVFSTSSLFTDSLALTVAPVSTTASSMASPAPVFSTSSLFTDSLALTVAPVSTTASCAASPAPLFSALPVPTSSGPTDALPQPPLCALPSTPAPPACLSLSSCSPSFSLPSAAELAPLVVQPQVSSTASLPPPADAWPASDSLLDHSLQDLAMLDLSSPRNTPGMLDPSGLLGMDETLGATVVPSPSVGVSSSRSSPLPLGVMPGAPVQPPTTTGSQADDSPLLLRSLSPVLLPLGHASPPILPLGHASPPILPLGHVSPARGQDISLANVVVPLDAIKPSKVCPVTAYDKDGVRVLLHFATACPPGRPDVLVMVASMLNTAPLPIRNVVLQAAVPKSMKVRLQPPSGTELAPFNPILPPAAITQVMLLANPLKEKVRMRYKLTFTLGEQSCTEEGEVDRFPPAEGWGAL